MMKMIKGAWWIMWFQNHVKCWERSTSVLWFRKSHDTIVMLLLVMCLARPEAPGQAMPCQSRPGQARPCSMAWRGFWPGSSLMRPEPSPQALASVVYIVWKIGIRITCQNTKTYLHANGLWHFFLWPLRFTRNHENGNLNWEQWRRESKNHHATKSHSICEAAWQKQLCAGCTLRTSTSSSWSPYCHRTGACTYCCPWFNFHFWQHFYSSYHAVG